MNAQPNWNTVFSLAQGIHHPYPSDYFGWSEPMLTVESAPSLATTMQTGAQGRVVTLVLAEGYRDISFGGKRAIQGIPDQWKSVDVGPAGRWNLVRLALPKGMALLRSGGPEGWKRVRFTSAHSPSERAPDYPFAVAIYDDSGTARFLTLVAYANTRRA